MLKTKINLLPVEASPAVTKPEEDRNRYKISIVIPMLDGISIEPTLDSLVRQTFDDYEVIVVDGRRAEESAIDEAFKNALGDKLSIPKAGVEAKTIGALFDIGIKFASGRYVMLMNGGDVLEPEALDTLFSTAERTNADAMYCTDVEKPIRLLFDIADRIRKFANGTLGMAARGRILRREFLIRNRIDFSRLKAAEEPVYSFCLACSAENYVLAPNTNWTFGAEVETASEDLSFFEATSDAFELLDDFMKGVEFFTREPDYRYVVLNCINEYCKKYLHRDKMTPYEFYEAVLKEIKANRAAFNRAAFLAYNFCTANWQYAQILKKDREIRALNEEIKKVRDEKRS